MRDSTCRLIGFHNLPKTSRAAFQYTRRNLTQFRRIEEHRYLVLVHICWNCSETLESTTRRQQMRILYRPNCCCFVSAFNRLSVRLNALSTPSCLAIVVKIPSLMSEMSSNLVGFTHRLCYMLRTSDRDPFAGTLDVRIHIQCWRARLGPGPWSM